VAQKPDRSRAQSSFQRVGKLVVSLPTPHAQGCDALAGRLRGLRDASRECHLVAIADQLQRMFRPRPACQELDHYGTVATSQRGP